MCSVLCFKERDERRDFFLFSLYLLGVSSLWDPILCSSFKRNFREVRAQRARAGGFWRVVVLRHIYLYISSLRVKREKEREKERVLDVDVCLGETSFYYERRKREKSSSHKTQQTT